MKILQCAAEEEQFFVLAVLQDSLDEAQIAEQESTDKVDWGDLLAGLVVWAVITLITLITLITPMILITQITQSSY